MAEVPKSRLALDLEHIERQLRHSSPQPGSTRSDPLAELARIVGQDDPFRAMLAGDQTASQGGVRSDDIFARREPLFDDPRYAHGGPAASYQDHGVALTAEEEAILRGEHDSRYSPAPHEAELYYQDVPGYAEPETTFTPVEPRRSRRGLIAVGAVLGAALLGGAGAIALRSGGSSIGSDGEPPVVMADTGPSKVVPQNPGGVDFPNQNKQIYERAAQDTPTRVVNREEQPVDVRQATRVGGAMSDGTAGPAPVRMSPAVPSSASVNAAPSLQGTSNATVGILGEPRRVRTVSIRPDGTVVMPDQGGIAAPAAAPPRAEAPAAPAQGPTTPGAASGAAPASQAKMTPPQRPRESTSTPTAPRPATPATSAADSIGAPLQITSEAVRPKGESRLAGIPPALLREPTETSAAPTASAGFSVQLGVRNTEREGRAMFEQLQQRFASDLSGLSPMLRQAEINGKPAYRVRVGPMSRDDAVSLCSRLKASGGQCFVANN